jgi:(p)ppGpp synthase/HD superfamily hydrolase
VNIIDLNITGEGQVKQDTLIIQVNDLGHLQEVMRQLKHIPNVLNVSRLMKKDSHDPNNHFND